MAGDSAHYDKQSLTEVQAAGETARQKEKLQRSIEKPQKEIIIWYVGQSHILCKHLRVRIERKLKGSGGKPFPLASY